MKISTIHFDDLDLLFSNSKTHFFEITYSTATDLLMAVNDPIYEYSTWVFVERFIFNCKMMFIWAFSGVLKGQHNSPRLLSHPA